jgi:hypothetical protein
VSAQPPSAIVIRAESPWGWWGVRGDLMAAALEGATTAARARGLRVLAAPPVLGTVPVLTLAVDAGRPQTVAIAGITAQAVNVTVRATLERPDGDIWRGSQTRGASWLIAPIALGDPDAAIRGAAHDGAAAVADAALDTFLPPRPPPADGGR